MVKNLPLKISIITTLDALSHAFESIWNKNANPISTNYAIEAIRLIMENIVKTSEQTTLDTRKKLLLASMYAGLAFSNTQTAAAHAISYPLTLHYGIPHGLAAAMPLIPLLRKNKDFISINSLLTKLHLKSIDELEQMIMNVSSDILSLSLKDWGITITNINKVILPNCYNKQRLDNNVISLTCDDIQEILNYMYE